MYLLKYERKEMREGERSICSSESPIHQIWVLEIPQRGESKWVDGLGPEPLTCSEDSVAGCE